MSLIEMFNHLTNLCDNWYRDAPLQWEGSKLGINSVPQPLGSGGPKWYPGGSAASTMCLGNTLLHKSSRAPLFLWEWIIFLDS